MSKITQTIRSEVEVGKISLVQDSKYGIENRLYISVLTNSGGTYLDAGEIKDLIETLNEFLVILDK